MYFDSGSSTIHPMARHVGEAAVPGEAKMAPAYVRLPRPYEGLVPKTVGPMKVKPQSPAEPAPKPAGPRKVDPQVPAQKPFELEPVSVYTSLAEPQALARFRAAGAAGKPAKSDSKTSQPAQPCPRQHAEATHEQGRASAPRARAGQKPRAVAEEGALDEPPRSVPSPLLRPLEPSATTVVVQNLPGKYSQQEVLEVWPADGTFDFMHIPYNLLQKRPLGYAFINFLTHELAVAFQQKWHGETFPRGGWRPLDIATAEVQGKLANLELIKSRKVGQLEKAGFLPLVFKNATRLDSRGILAEMVELRLGKVVISNEVAKDAKQQAEAPPRVERPAPEKEKEDGAGDVDSDAPTTAPGTEVGSADRDWVEEHATSKDAPQSSAMPMYISRR